MQTMVRRGTRAPFALIMLTALSFAPTLAEARCATPRHYVELLTPLDRPLPVGGHLVVAIRVGHRAADGPEIRDPFGDAPSIEGLALVQGAARIALRSESIGGGLFRMIPERALTEGTYTLVGFRETSQTTGETRDVPREVVVRGALPPPPAAIEVTSARYDQAATERTRWGSRTRYSSTYRFGEALPSGLVAVGLVAPSGWIHVQPRAGARELAASGAFGGSHCGDGQVPGVTRPEDGLRVRLALVDAYGRVVVGQRAVRIE